MLRQTCEQVAGRFTSLAGRLERGEQVSTSLLVSALEVGAEVLRRAAAHRVNVKGLADAPIESRE